MPDGKTGFRKDIEGFRAVAVLLVVFFHAHLFGCAAGFLGVDLFFVLSGYLITGLLIAETERTGTVGLLAFYARRARRLLPASFVMLLAASLAAAWILPPFEQATLSRSVLAASAYLANVYFFHVATDYFTAYGSTNPLLHTWSLAVEEQFYFVWPLLMLLVWRIKRSRGAVCILMAVLGIVSLAACIHVTPSNQPMTFYLMPFRVWEFAIGGLASQIPRTWLVRRPVAVRWLGWVAFTSILISAWTLSNVGFPGSKALLPALGAIIVLVAGSLEDRAGIGRLLKSHPLPYLGQRSYALYLWHWPILILAGILQDPLSLRNRILCVAAGFVLAELSFVFLEHPIRSNPWLKHRALLCMTASALIAMAGISAGFAWRYWAVRTTNYRRFGAAMSDLPQDQAQGCLTPYGEANVHPCTFGSVSAQAHTIVLIGDSHMEQWLPAFQQITQRRQWKIVLLVKSACPAVDIATAYLWSKHEDRSCILWRQQAFASALALHPAALILANASWYTTIDSAGTKEPPAQWTSGAKRTFTSLPPAHPPVIFLRDTPQPLYDPALCLARADWSRLYHCPPLVRAQVLDEAMYQGQKAGADGIPGISFIDLSDKICGKDLCDLTQNDLVVFRDATHLTATFARSLAPDLERSLDAAAPSL